jgi:hypothetical protein
MVEVQRCVEKCQDCCVQSCCKKRIDFEVVRHVRSALYGTGSTTKARKKLIAKWVQFMMAEAGKQKLRLGIDHDPKSRLAYQIPDMSFSADEDKIRWIPCCRKCFTYVTGIAKGTMSNVVNRVKDNDVLLTLTEDIETRFMDSSPERLQVTAWFEYFVAHQSCYNPDKGDNEKTASVPCNIADMYHMFCEDWRDGVMAQDSFRVYKGSSKWKERKVVQENEDEERVKENNPPPSKSFFYKIWKSDYNENYAVPRGAKRFTQCNWCALLKHQHKHVSDLDQKRNYRDALYGHYKWITVQRQKYYKHRHKAASHPSKYVRK